MGEQIVATGRVASAGRARGIFRHVAGVEDVVALLAGDVTQAILSTDHASVTAIVPILPQVRGVVCREGGLTSHLAIVTRQLGVPCVVGAQFSVPSARLEGGEVAIDSDGRLWAAADVGGTGR